mmetsp:Transcript_115768/g.307823  ORF Transcript_115768/g.307823 Transcript_115768/m.307823 type:complete len:214 (-) Transcript_115768:57-698(-)
MARSEEAPPACCRKSLRAANWLLRRLPRGAKSWATRASCSRVATERSWASSGWCSLSTTMACLAALIASNSEVSVMWKPWFSFMRKAVAVPSAFWSLYISSIVDFLLAFNSRILAVASSMVAFSCSDLCVPVSMAWVFSLSLSEHQQESFSCTALSSSRSFWSSACMSFSKRTTFITGRSLKLTATSSLRADVFMAAALQTRRAKSARMAVMA